MRIYPALLAVLILAGCSKHDGPAALSVTGYSVTHGPENSIVIINGTGFSPVALNDQVYFNGVQAIATSATSTQIQVTVPHRAGTGKVTVTVGTQHAAGPVFMYDYSDAQITTVIGGPPLNGFEPTGITVDAQGTLYVVDHWTGAIKSYSSGGGASSNVVVQQGIISGPNCIAKDGSGNLYITAAGGSTTNFVYKVTTAGAVYVLAGVGPSGYQDGSAAAARFRYPQGIVVDPSGNVYVADYDNNVIREITPSNTVSTIAGGGSQASGSALTVAIYNPGRLALDRSGNLIIGCAFSETIQEWSPAGQVTTLAGAQVTSADVDGPLGTARFVDPEGVAVDTLGNVFVAEHLGNKLRVINASGVVTTVSGTQGQGFVDGYKATAQLNLPSTVAVDPSQMGVLYFIDDLNYAVRKAVLE